MIALYFVSADNICTQEYSDSERDTPPIADVLASVSSLFILILVEGELKIDFFIV